MYVYVYILGNMHRLLEIVFVGKISVSLKLLYLITGCLQDVY